MFRKFLILGMIQKQFYNFEKQFYEFELTK